MKWRLGREMIKVNDANCPICGMKFNEPISLSPFAPSMCQLETTLKVNGVIQMRFIYGDDFDRITYYPKYCPECGRKVLWK